MDRGEGFPPAGSRFRIPVSACGGGGAEDQCGQAGDVAPAGDAVGGYSVSYSGRMVKYLPSEPGTLSESVDAGKGVFSMTCP